MALLIPNVDPILDPAYARAESRRVFGDQLDVGREVADYGSQLFKRVFVSGGRNTVADLMAIGSLFRQALAAYDGCLVCLSEGAVGAGEVQLRVQFEASLGVYWILRSDGERDRWGRQYYVFHVRQERQLAQIAIPGSRQHREHVKAWKATFGREPEFPDDLVEEMEARLIKIDALLNSAPYQEINRWFKDQKKKQRGREPEWYRPGPSAPQNLRDVAEQLGRSAEYNVLYRQLSFRTHASRPTGSVGMKGGGLVVVEPIRQLEQFPFVFSMAAYAMIGVYRRLLEVYRPGEFSTFRETYRENWRKRLAAPNVAILPEYVRL